VGAGFGQVSGHAAACLRPTRRRAAKLSFEIAGESPAECAAIVKSELERWGSIVKVSGFSLDE
jgi:hypothetical protein